MRKLLGHQVGHRDIEEIIRDVDLNGDGRVDFEGRQGLKTGAKWASHGAKRRRTRKSPIPLTSLCFAPHSLTFLPSYLCTCQSTPIPVRASVYLSVIHTFHPFISSSVQVQFVTISKSNQYNIDPCVDPFILHPFIQLYIHPCVCLSTRAPSHVSPLCICVFFHPHTLS